jgi:hypothetical protein
MGERAGLFAGSRRLARDGRLDHQHDARSDVRAVARDLPAGQGRPGGPNESPRSTRSTSPACARVASTPELPSERRASIP